MAKKNKRSVHQPSILLGDGSETSEMPNNQSSDRTPDKKPPSFWASLGRGERIGAVAICLLLVMGALGAGLGDKIISTFGSKNTQQGTNQTAKNNGSFLSARNPFAEPPLPTATLQLSKEYIYAGSRMLAVEDANAPAATPTPPPPTPTPPPGNGCTPTTTVTEGDLFPGGIPSFGVSSGAGSVTVDSVNAGSGLQQLSVVGTPTNAVVVTFTTPSPGLAVDFTLRAASTNHAIFVRVRCGGTTQNTFSGRATAVNATINGVNGVLADTGALPAAGGFIRRELVSGNLFGGALTTGTLDAITQGAFDQSRSQAIVENLNLNVGGNIITSVILSQSSTCTCAASGPSCVGGLFGNLVINGGTVAITGQPNQTVNLASGGTVTINKQIPSGAGNAASLTANGVHVLIPGVADVILSSARSDITCATQ